MRGVQEQSSTPPLIRLTLLGDMPTYLGIDYGEKRIGLSHGDELGFAFALEPAVDPDPEARFARIGEEIRRRRVAELVVGYPLRLDGSRSRTTDAADAFIAELERRFALPVHRVDEGLSSAAAAESLRSGVARSSARSRPSVTIRRGPSTRSTTKAIPAHHDAIDTDRIAARRAGIASARSKKSPASVPGPVDIHSAA